MADAKRTVQVELDFVTKTGAAERALGGLSGKAVGGGAGAVIRQLTELLGIQGSKLESSTGMAARESRFASLDEYIRGFQTAGVGGGGPTPAEEQVSILQQIY